MWPAGTSASKLKSESEPMTVSPQPTVPPTPALSQHLYLHMGSLGLLNCQPQ